MLDNNQYKTILVGVDGSEQALEAFQKSVAVAKRNDAKIILVHVIENRLFGNMGYTLTSSDLIDIETDRAKDMLIEYKKYANDQGFMAIETSLMFGSPKVVMTKEIPEQYTIDLIMLGQSGLNAVERFMIGSVSEYIIRHAKCDVLIVRSHEKKE